VREGLLDLVSTEENLEPITHQDETPEFKYHRYFLISPDLLHSTAGILESLQPLMEKDKPMVGFSTEEACQAAAITYITTDSETDPDLMRILKSRGSLISMRHPQEISSLIRENNYEVV
jgi:hypothetical protein